MSDQLLPAELDLALLDALDAAVVVSDPSGQIFLWNRAAEALYGYSREDMLGANVMELLVRPEDRELGGEIMTKVLAGQAWTGEFPVRCADGSTKRVQITDSPLVRDGRLVGVVGLAEDVTERRVAEMRSADREAELRLALDAAELGTWRWDLTTGVTEWDERLERAFGLTPGGFDGTFAAWTELIHPEDREAVLAEIERTVTERSSYEVRHRVVWPDGSVHWIEGRGQVTLDRSGAVTGTVGAARDVTERVEAEQRLARLHEVAEALAAAWTVEDVVAGVSDRARAVIGAVAGVIGLPDRGGRRFRLVRSPDQALRSSDLTAVLPTGAHGPLVDAVRTGAAGYLRDAAEAVERYPHLAELLRRTGWEAMASLPMRGASGAVIGVLLLACDVPRVFSRAERSLLESIASQCAVALERAQLLTETRRVAERLQAGLAPHDVPDVPGVDVGTCYRPGGAEAEQIGGDWYDVLPQSDGSVVLVVGDVMGRGVDAAATMTQLRSAVRAFATVDPDPRVVLGKTDGFAARALPEEFATLIYARLDPSSGRLEVVLAGHPPAVAVLPDADPELLDIPESPPLGLATEPRAVRVDTLPADAVLLLTTDGLVERPGVDIPDALRAAGARAQSLLATGLSPEAAAEELAHIAGPADADDVTVLLVRLAAR